MMQCPKELKYLRYLLIRKVDMEDVSECVSFPPTKLNILNKLYPKNSLSYLELMDKVIHDSSGSDTEPTILRHLLELNRRGIIDDYFETRPLHRRFALTRYGKVIYNMIGKAALKLKQEGLLSDRNDNENI